MGKVACHLAGYLLTFCISDDERDLFSSGKVRYGESGSAVRRADYRKLDTPCGAAYYVNEEGI